MSELIDRQAFIEQERKLYCEDCDRRKGTKNGKPNVICYEIGEAPCRACWLDDALGDLEDFPAASPWHRVEDDAEFLSLIISYICSYSVENGMEPDDSLRTIAQNILKLLEISTFNNWMPIEPPKEDA